MDASFLTPMLLAQQEVAIRLAGMVTAPITQEETFLLFWQRVPISEAVNHALMKDKVPLKGRIFFSSGGSTGSPKYTFLDFQEVLGNSAQHGKGYQACGIEPTDVVATWGVPGIMTSEFTVYLALAETGCCILPIGDAADPATVVSLIRDFAATVLLVMPSDLNPVVAWLEQQGQTLEHIRLVVVGGEALLTADQLRYAKRLGYGVVFRSVFQTSDTGTIGYQCQYCAPGEFHVHSDMQLLELINVGDDGVGDLITTNLQRHMMPVVRQRTGDLARRIDEPCVCGQRHKIKLCGRTGRFVKIGGEKFDLSWLTILQEKLALESSDFRMVLERDESGRDRLRLVSDRVAADTTLQASATRLFSELSSKLVAQLARGVVGPLVFSAMANYPVLLTAAGKTRFFEDQRQKLD